MKPKLNIGIYLIIYVNYKNISDYQFIFKYFLQKKTKEHSVSLYVFPTHLSSKTSENTFCNTKKKYCSLLNIKYPIFLIGIMCFIVVIILICKYFIDL